MHCFNGICEKCSSHDDCGVLDLPYYATNGTCINGTTDQTTMFLTNQATNLQAQSTCTSINDCPNSDEWQYNCYKGMCEYTDTCSSDSDCSNQNSAYVYCYKLNGRSSGQCSMCKDESQCGGSTPFCNY